MARTTPTYTPIGKYALAFIVSLSLLISDINYQIFSNARGFVQATGIHSQLFLQSLLTSAAELRGGFKDKIKLVKINNDLSNELLKLQNKVFLDKELLSLNADLLV